MTLKLTDTETVEMLQILKERKFKYMSLSALAAARSGKNKYSINALKLARNHKAKSDSAQTLIDKIVEQL